MFGKRVAGYVNVSPTENVLARVIGALVAGGLTLALSMLLLRAAPIYEASVTLNMQPSTEELRFNSSFLGVSQFTLFGDARKGRRPSFVNAMEPVEAMDPRTEQAVE